MSEDMWHVQMEPGDVKTVTLEQMDDMYRLEIISSSTLVWQPGMPKALPLSVVAGIEEESDVMEIEPELIPEPEPLPSYAQPQASYPPPQSYVPAPVQAPISHVPQVRQDTMAPPPPSVGTLQAASPAAPAPAMPTADFYSPESLRPITMSDTPFRPKKSGTAGRVVMGIAIAAGLLITLHRNDLLQDMGPAKSIDAALGSPGFGTTRSVATLSAMLNPPLEMPSTETTTTSSSTTRADTDTDTSTSTSTESESSESKSAAQTTKKNSPAKARPAPRRHAPAKRQSKAPAKKLKSFKSSEYDPMNAKL